MMSGVNPNGDRWTSGDAYERYMGRWSRPIAQSFVEWLRVAPGSDWLEIGCGTGALTETICRLADPGSVLACDLSESFLDHARSRVSDPRVSFVLAGANDLPRHGRRVPTDRREGGFDAIVSGLVLNHVPEPEKAVAGMRERLRPGGCVAAYVWDYAGRMEFLRVFWDEAAALDPAAAELDQGRRFPLCQPAALTALFRSAGLDRVETCALEQWVEFEDFADYWDPFLAGTGPAPAYVCALEPGRREQLRERLRRRLQPEAGERIRLFARAWGVRGLSLG
jgi:SAM-dependent methyltransferase